MKNCTNTVGTGTNSSYEV